MRKEEKQKNFLVITVTALCTVTAGSSGSFTEPETEESATSSASYSFITGFCLLAYLFISEEIEDTGSPLVFFCNILSFP